MQIPRVELVEMGPSMNLALRRLRAAGQDMEHEAMSRVKPTKKKASPAPSYSLRRFLPDCVNKKEMICATREVLRLLLEGTKSGLAC